MFPYTDKFQESLESSLTDYFTASTYKKTFNVTQIREFQKHYFKQVSNITEIYPLVEFVVEPYASNKVYIINQKQIRSIFSKRKDRRLEYLFVLLSNTIEWCKKQDIKLPNKARMFFWIADRSPWDSAVSQDFPLFVIAKPSNMSFPLYPDISYFEFHTDQKYRGKHINWDQTKDVTLSLSPKTDWTSKTDEIFFKGVSTTNKASKIREKLEAVSHTPAFPNLNVSLDGWKRFEPFYRQQNYKYFLDLPGWYPWSVRFKYLFLVNGSIIKINEKWFSREEGWEDERWVQLFDSIMPTNYYHSITSYYNADAHTFRLPDEIRKEASQENEEQFWKTLRKIERVIEEIDQNPEREVNRIRLGRERALKLTNDKIYQYMAKAILACSKLKYSFTHS